MKTKKIFNKKLILKKETITNLNLAEMVAVYGGTDTFDITICKSLCQTNCTGCNTRLCE